MKGTRIKRSVWHVGTKPFAEAHFATFPPALIEPCILAGTSARGACPACGAPWKRVVKRAPAAGKVSGNLERKNRQEHGGLAEDARHQAFGIPWEPSVAETTTWAQTCKCAAGTPVPCVVLDPFGGAGTTGLVADRHGRDAVLVELSPAYAKMAEDRIRQDGPLFADVVPGKSALTETEAAATVAPTP